MPLRRPLRAAYFSDLHLEHSRVRLETQGADVVVLAGDILETERARPEKTTTVIDRIAQDLVPNPDTPVVFVPGNHDFIGNVWTEALEVWRAISRQRYDGRVRVLVNEVWDWDGVRFLGTPLFTDFASGGDAPACMERAATNVCDFLHIRAPSGRPVLPYDWFEEHTRARAFLDAHLPAAGVDPEDGRPRVVVSHWCPSLQAVSGAKRRAGGLLAPYWVSNDDDLVARAHAWVFGHTHHCVNLVLGGAPGRGRLVSNARGTSKFFNLADPNFRHNAVLEIPR